MDSDSKYSLGHVDLDGEFTVFGERWAVAVLDKAAQRDQQRVAEVYGSSGQQLADRARLVAQAFNIALTFKKTPLELSWLVAKLSLALVDAQTWLRNDFEACRTPADVWHERNAAIDAALVDIRAMLQATQP